MEKQKTRVFLFVRMDMINQDLKKTKKKNVFLVLHHFRFGFSACFFGFALYDAKNIVIPI
jgi:hypothetical protein